MWNGALLPFGFEGSFVSMGRRPRDTFYGPICYQLPAKQAYYLVEQAASACCLESAGTTTFATNTTGAWDSLWSGCWWIRAGTFLGAALSVFIDALVLACLRGRVGPYPPLALVDAKFTFLAMHAIAAAEAKAARAREQITQGRRWLAATLE